MNLISTADAARRLHVTPRRLYRYIDEGLLPAYREGRRIVLDADEVERFTPPPEPDFLDGVNDREPRRPIKPKGAGSIALDPPTQP